MENDPYSDILLITSILAFVAIIMTLLAFFAMYRKKLVSNQAKLKAAEFEKERLLHRRQIETLALINEAEEKLNERMARDLHDGVIPLVSTVARSIEKNAADFGTPEFKPQRLSHDAKLLEQVSITLRGISHDLVPPYLLSHGLLAALKDFVEQMSGLYKGRAMFENRSGFNKHLPFSLAEQLNIYRICLEQLNNLNKHSGYEFLSLGVESEAETLLFIIQHDGAGLSQQTFEALSQLAGGLGLKSIQARAALLNATIEYTTAGDVSTISLSVPFGENKLKAHEQTKN